MVTDSERVASFARAYERHYQSKYKKRKATKRDLDIAAAKAVATLKKITKPKVSIPVTKRVLVAPTRVQDFTGLLGRRVVRDVSLPRRIKMTPIQKLKPVTTTIVKVADFVSGGSITARKLKKEQEIIDERVARYNKKYSGELSRTAYNQAIEERKIIEKKKSKLKITTASLEKTFKRKYIGAAIWGVGEKSLESQVRKGSLQKENIAKLTSELKKLKTKRKAATSKLNKKRLDFLINNVEKTISDRKAGVGAKLFLGTPPPLIPAGIGIPTNTKVLYGGTTKRVGNVQVSNIRFQQLKSSGKVSQVGKANVYSILKGKKTFSITIGKFSKVSGKDPKTFVGVQGGKSVDRVLIKRTIVELTKGKKYVGNIEISKALNKIDLKTAAAVGRVAVRGVKTSVKYPTAKFTKQVTIDVKDFSTLARSMTQKDISLIVGKTITKQQDRVQFLGLIKQIGKRGTTTKLTGGQLQQYQKAIQQTSAVFSAALNKAKTASKVVPKISTTTIAANIIKTTAKSKPTAQMKPQTLITPKLTKATISPTIAKTIQNTKAILGTTTVTKLVSKTKSSARSKAKVIGKEIILEKQKIGQLKKSAVINKSKLISKGRTKLKTLQSQLQILNLVVMTPIPITANLIRILPAIKLPKIRKKKKKAVVWKKRIGYNAYVKVRGKLMKVNKIPLSKIGAKNRVAYVIDHSTAVGGSIRKVGKVKKLMKVTTRERGARKKIKGRKYRIVKGKRKLIKNAIIEKKGKPRINTRGEKKGLSAAKVLKRLRRKKVVRKKKK